MYFLLVTGTHFFFLSFFQLISFFFSFLYISLSSQLSRIWWKFQPLWNRNRTFRNTSQHRVTKRKWTVHKITSSFYSFIFIFVFFFSIQFHFISFHFFPHDSAWSKSLDTMLCHVVLPRPQNQTLPYTALSCPTLKQTYIFNPPPS